jgi:CHAD domain-containing protein
MKRQAMEQVIDQHIHKIKKHSLLVPGSFVVDDIHDIRVEYKKLRAFLRLLQLQIPEKLKVLYKAAGAVRDLQLFLTVNIPAPLFIQTKQKQLFSCKESLVGAIEDIHFKKVSNEIKKQLPHQLPDNALQKFIQQKIAAIHILSLVADEEKNLHAIRKNYKDIIYNNKLFGVENESMNAIATQLGDFNDRCIALSILKDRDGTPEEAILDKLESQWEEEKRSLLQHFFHLHTS